MSKNILLKCLVSASMKDNDYFLRHYLHVLFLGQFHTMSRLDMNMCLWKTQLTLPLMRKYLSFYITLKYIHFIYKLFKIIISKIVTYLLSQNCYCFSSSFLTYKNVCCLRSLYNHTHIC